MLRRQNYCLFLHVVDLFSEYMFWLECVRHNLFGLASWKPKGQEQNALEGAIVDIPKEKAGDA